VIVGCCARLQPVERSKEMNISNLSKSPAVAFLVSGQCRPSPLLVGQNDTRASVSALLARHAQHVVAPHEADRARSAVFLLMKERAPGECGGGSQCSHYKGLRCVHAIIKESSCQAACPECRMVKSSGGTRYPSVKTPRCFHDVVLEGWSPLWCTMYLAWQHVLADEQRSGAFDRIVFSRVDNYYQSSMGHWSAYTQHWHSGSLYCHDMFWVLSRRMATCSLAVYPIQLRCPGRGTPCCNTRWRVSWWVWCYCTSKLGPNPDVRHLHGVQGSFALELRRDPSGMRQCMGAPSGTFVADPGTPTEKRLVDADGMPWACGQKVAV